MNTWMRTTHYTRIGFFFVRDVAQFLRPPHVIELLLLTIWRTESTGIINGPDYLNELGFYQMGTVQHVDEIIQMETFFPLTAFEEDIVNGLTGSELLLDSSREFCELRWDQYRCERWVFESRAKIFSVKKRPRGCLSLSWVSTVTGLWMRPLEIILHKIKILARHYFRLWILYRTRQSHENPWNHYIKNVLQASHVKDCRIKTNHYNPAKDFSRSIACML